jgi:hypothetical protein
VNRAYVFRLAESITTVRVMSVGALNVLRVHRRAGFTLGAFSRFRVDELRWAADALRAALNLSA